MKQFIKVNGSADWVKYTNFENGEQDAVSEMRRDRKERNPAELIAESRRDPRWAIPMSA